MCAVYSLLLNVSCYQYYVFAFENHVDQIGNQLLIADRCTNCRYIMNFNFEFLFICGSSESICHLYFIVRIKLLNFLAAFIYLKEKEPNRRLDPSERFSQCMMLSDSQLMKPVLILPFYAQRNRQTRERESNRNQNLQAYE